MGDVASSSLISQHPSTSGLQISLHPLALLTISDYITRHSLRQQAGPIIGALVGRQSGREFDIEHAYEVLALGADVDVSIEPKWFEQKLKLFKETHRGTDLLGWFTTTTSHEFVPTAAHAAIHQQLLQYNESLIMLLLNPTRSAAIGGSGTLPIAIYESLYDADEKDANAPLRLKFVPLKYTIETGEAEMIAVDFVAKGGFGNAGAVAGADGGSSAARKGKGKEKAEDGERRVEVGTQNDELLANLTAKRNAILMLHSRLKLLLKYLNDPLRQSEPNHELLRALWSLTNSRLSLLTPANAAAFKQERLAEESDVNLVVLLGTLTKSIEEVRSVGRKFAYMETAARSWQKVVGGGGGGGGPGVGGLGGMGGMGMGMGMGMGVGKEEWGGGGAPLGPVGGRKGMGPFGGFHGY